MSKKFAQFGNVNAPVPSLKEVKANIRRRKREMAARHAPASPEKPAFEVDTERPDPTVDLLFAALPSAKEIDPAKDEGARRLLALLANDAQGKSAPPAADVAETVGRVQTVLHVADRFPIRIKHQTRQYARVVSRLYFWASRIEGVNLPEFPDAEEMGVISAIRHLENLRQAVLPHVKRNGRPAHSSTKAIGRLSATGADGEWLIPTTMADMANRLGNMSVKKAKTVLRSYDLKQSGNRQSWTVRLTSMPQNMREKLER